VNTPPALRVASRSPLEGGKKTSQGRKPLVCPGFKPSPGRATEDSYIIAICRPSGAHFFLYPYRGLTPPANVLNAPSGLGILYFKLQTLLHLFRGLAFSPPPFIHHRFPNNQPRTSNFKLQTPNSVSPFPGASVFAPGSVGGSMTCSTNKHRGPFPNHRSFWCSTFMHLD
jgi:hypothetical protein